MPGWQVRVVTPPGSQEVYVVNGRDERAAVDLISLERGPDVKVILDGKVSEETLSFLNVPLGQAKKL